MRCYALTEALAERFRVVLLARRRRCRTGIAPPRGVELVALPPLGVNGGRFGSGDPRYSTEHAWEVRSARILRRCDERAPGRRARRAVPVRAREVRARAGPAARAAARAAAPSPPAACATSSSPRARTSRSTTTARARLADAYLDAVLVHCDPALRPAGGDVQPERRARPCPSTTPGFVSGRDGGAAPRRAASTSSSPPAAGASARRCCEEAMDASDGRPMRAIAGPLMPEEDCAALAGASRRPTWSCCARSPTSPHELSQAAREHQPVRLQHRARPRAHRASRRWSSRTPTPEENEQTPPRAPARAARRAQGRHAHQRRHRRAAGVHAAPGVARPRRRGQDRGAAVRPAQVLRPTSCASGARCPAPARGHASSSRSPSWPSRGRSR